MGPCDSQSLRTVSGRIVAITIYSESAHEFSLKITYTQKAEYKVGSVKDTHFP